MPGKYLRGALIHLNEGFLVPVPNVIVFQYNPETMTHRWDPPGDAQGLKAAGVKSKEQGCDLEGAVTAGDPLAASGYPGETFNFTISMDANDAIADGNDLTAGIARVSGIYSRLAALELLQYPVIRDREQAGLTGSVSLANLTAGAFGASIVSADGKSRKVPQMVLRPVLFVWGAGRVVPVRVMSLTITEKLYDALLNPTHADAELGLRVLTPGEMNALPKVMKAVTQGAYAYTHALRQALAISNTAEAAIGLVS